MQCQTCRVRVLREKQIVCPKQSVCFRKADVHGFTMKKNRFRRMKLSGGSTYRGVAFRHIAVLVPRSVGEVSKCCRSWWENRALILIIFALEKKFQNFPDCPVLHDILRRNHNCGIDGRVTAKTRLSVTGLNATLPFFCVYPVDAAIDSSLSMGAKLSRVLAKFRGCKVRIREL